MLKRSLRAAALAFAALALTPAVSSACRVNADVPSPDLLGLYAAASGFPELPPVYKPGSGCPDDELGMYALELNAWVARQRDAANQQVDSPEGYVPDPYVAEVPDFDLPNSPGLSGGGNPYANDPDIPGVDNPPADGAVGPFAADAAPPGPDGNQCHIRPDYPRRSPPQKTAPGPYFVSGRGVQICVAPVATQGVSVCVDYRTPRAGTGGWLGFDCKGNSRSSAGKVSAKPMSGCSGRMQYRTTMFGNVTRPNGQSFVSPIRKTRAVTYRC